MALAESALRGGIGFEISVSAVEPHRWLFSESPSRVVLGVAPRYLDEVLGRLGRADLEASVLGRTGGDALDFGWFSVPLQSAKDTFERALPRRLQAPTMSGA